MIQILKKNINKNNKIYLKNFFGNINIFFYDKYIDIPKKIKIKINKNKIYFKGPLGNLELFFPINIFILRKNNKILINLDINKKINQKKKKSIIFLYQSLIKKQIKGVLQGFKIILFLQGIGFKTLIENNFLILKLGFSHNIKIEIPLNIKIILQYNQLIFNSIDYKLLTQFIYYIRNLKKPEPYKGKGILLKNEQILRKEGKKSKK